VVTRSCPALVKYMQGRFSSSISKRFGTRSRNDAYVATGCTKNEVSLFWFFSLNACQLDAFCVYVTYSVNLLSLRYSTHKKMCSLVSSTEARCSRKMTHSLLCVQYNSNT
jgi:hypothetical protein